MLNPNILLNIGATASIYPGKDNAVKAEIINSDNTKSEITIRKEEADLALYLKTIRHKLASHELDRIVSLIEDYGSMKYEEGSNDSEL